MDLFLNDVSYDFTHRDCHAAKRLDCDVVSRNHVIPQNMCKQNRMIPKICANKTAWSPNYVQTKTTSLSKIVSQTTSHQSHCKTKPHHSTPTIPQTATFNQSPNLMGIKLWFQNIELFESASSWSHFFAKKIALHLNLHTHPIHAYITLHYITLRCIALHCIKLHYNLLHYIQKLHYITSLK